MTSVSGDSVVMVNDLCMQGPYAPRITTKDNGAIDRGP
jgi:hypothetical protein